MVDLRKRLARANFFHFNCKFADDKCLNYFVSVESYNQLLEIEKMLQSYFENGQKLDKTETIGHLVSLSLLFTIRYHKFFLIKLNLLSQAIIFGVDARISVPQIFSKQIYLGRRWSHLAESGTERADLQQTPAASFCIREQLVLAFIVGWPLVQLVSQSHRWARISERKREVSPMQCLVSRQVSVRVQPTKTVFFSI